MTEKPRKPRYNWNRPIAGAQRPGARKEVAVYGKSSQLAYSRGSETKLVTYACTVCGQQKTEYRYPGFLPKYCGNACREQAAIARNEKRVAQQREKRRTARAAHTPD
jgi:ferredoxin